MTKSKSYKATDRETLRLWTETLDYWTRQAKFYFGIRYTWTRVPVNADDYWAGKPPAKIVWREGTPEEGYAFCRRAFNMARGQVKVNRRRIAQAAASYLKNYKGK